MANSQPKNIIRTASTAQSNILLLPTPSLQPKNIIRMGPKIVWTTKQLAHSRRQRIRKGTCRSVEVESAQEAERYTRMQDYGVWLKLVQSQATMTTYLVPHTKIFSMRYEKLSSQPLSCAHIFVLYIKVIQYVISSLISQARQKRIFFISAEPGDEGYLYGTDRRMVSVEEPGTRPHPAIQTLAASPQVSKG